MSYKDYSKYLLDRDISIKNNIQNFLSRTNNIFKYENLPDTIPSFELEKILQTKGHCIFTKVNDSYYVLSGNFSGLPDVYDNQTEYTVSNVALNLTKNFKLNEDCILMQNDLFHSGLIPSIAKYSTLISDCEISLRLSAITSRIQFLISAPDDTTKKSADRFLEKIENGDLSVIGDNAFFDGVKFQNASGTSNNIQQLIELTQYVKSSCFHEIGLNANYNMKRERLTDDEIQVNENSLLPLIDSMLLERQKAVKKINDMYGLKITVDLQGVWKNEHEKIDREISNNLTDIGDNENENNDFEQSGKYNESNLSDANGTESTESTESDYNDSINTNRNENDNRENEIIDENHNSKDNKDNKENDISEKRTNQTETTIQENDDSESEQLSTETDFSTDDGEENEDDSKRKNK